MCICCGPLIKAIDQFIEKADGNLAETLDDEGYAEPKKTVEHIEGLEGDVTEALTEETAYIIAEAEKAVDLEAFSKDIWPDVKYKDSLRASLVTIFRDRFKKFMPEFVAYYLARTDKELMLESVSKRTTAWVDSWSEQLGEIMQLNSHKEIESILTKGLKDGKGIADFTRDILDSGIRDEYYKARRAALTEVLRAHSVAQQEAFMQSPAVAEKTWRHTGAYRNQPRQNHVDMSGQRVRKGEPFELTGINGGTYSIMYPRDTALPPEETINCHCICQPVINEDVLGVSLEERQRLQQEAITEMDDEWEKELDQANRIKAGIDPE